MHEKKKTVPTTFTPPVEPDSTLDDASHRYDIHFPSASFEEIKLRVQVAAAQSEPNEQFNDVIRSVLDDASGSFAATKEHLLLAICEELRGARIEGEEYDENMLIVNLNSMISCVVGSINFSAAPPFPVALDALVLEMFDFIARIEDVRIDLISVGEDLPEDMNFWVRVYSKHLEHLANLLKTPEYTPTEETQQTIREHLDTLLGWLESGPAVPLEPDVRMIQVWSFVADMCAEVGGPGCCSPLIEITRSLLEARDEDHAEALFASEEDEDDRQIHCNNCLTSALTALAKCQRDDEAVQTWHSALSRLRMGSHEWKTALLGLAQAAPDESAQQIVRVLNLIGKVDAKPAYVNGAMSFLNEYLLIPGTNQLVIDIVNNQHQEHMNPLRWGHFVAMIERTLGYATDKYSDIARETFEEIVRANGAN